MTQSIFVPNALLEPSDLWFGNVSFLGGSRDSLALQSNIGSVRPYQFVQRDGSSRRITWYDEIGPCGSPNAIRVVTYTQTINTIVNCQVTPLASITTKLRFDRRSGLSVSQLVGMTTQVQQWLGAARAVLPRS